MEPEVRMSLSPVNWTYTQIPTLSYYTNFSMIESAKHLAIDYRYLKLCRADHAKFNKSYS
jgi:hypothetical protein